MVDVQALIHVASNATPIVMASLGEVFVERTGRVNLGLEGMMAVAAAAAVAAGVAAGSPIASVAAAVAASLALALVYAVLVVYMGVDQVVVGLSLVFMGLGLGDLVGSLAGGAPATPLPSRSGIDPVMAAAPLACVAAWALLYKTTWGVEVRAVGDDEEAALERGIDVRVVRLKAVLVGGALAGVAGSYMALGLHYGRWFSGITAGWGWISLGAVILGYWHPLGVLVAGYLIGSLFAFRPLLPSLGVPEELSDAAPYVAVIALLAATTYIYERLGLKPPLLVWRRLL